MASSDYTQRFLFENTPIRGERVCLDNELKAVLEGHHYPAGIKQLLGEMVTASLLLSSTLKFSGTFTLQARSQGPVKLVVAECSDQKYFRATVRWDEAQIADEDPLSLPEWLPDGQVVITVDPGRGKRYQSIVVLNKPTFAECMTAYFRQSEQLPTQFWLACDGNKASGLLLQLLPENGAKHISSSGDIADQWNHTSLLAETVTRDELLNLDNITLLHRLFHESDIRLFDSLPVSFRCGCNRERTLRSLLLISPEETKSLIDETGHIDMQCQFCNRHYLFTAEEVERLHGAGH